MSNETSSRKPPRADFAHNWHGYIPIVHIDVKLPSEHTLCNKRYKGEYQIYFYHAKRKQPIVQSIFIEVHPRDRPHLHFQKAINEWQAIHDLSLAECQNHRRNTTKKRQKLIQKMSNSTSDFTNNDKRLIRRQVEGIGSLLPNQGKEKNIIMYESAEEQKLYQDLLRKARERVANPRFELKNDHIKNGIDYSINIQHIKIGIFRHVYHIFETKLLIR